MAKIELNIPDALLEEANKICNESKMGLNELIIVQLSLFVNKQNKKKKEKKG